MSTHHYTTENKLVVIKKQKKSYIWHTLCKSPLPLLVCSLTILKKERTFEPPRSGKRKKKKRSVDDVR